MATAIRDVYTVNIPPCNRMYVFRSLLKLPLSRVLGRVQPGLYQESREYELLDPSPTVFLVGGSTSICKCDNSVRRRGG